MGDYRQSLNAFDMRQPEQWELDVLFQSREDEAVIAALPHEPE